MFTTKTYAESKNISIEIPEHLIGKELKVIILPIEEKPDREKVKSLYGIWKDLNWPENLEEEIDNIRKEIANSIKLD